MSSLIIHNHFMHRTISDRHTKFTGLFEIQSIIYAHRRMSCLNMCSGFMYLTEAPSFVWTALHDLCAKFGFSIPQLYAAARLAVRALTSTASRVLQAIQYRNS